MAALHRAVAGGSGQAGSGHLARQNAAVTGHWQNSSEVGGPFVSSQSAAPPPIVAGKSQITGLPHHSTMRPPRSSPFGTGNIKQETPCSVELEPLLPELPTLKGPFKFKRPLRLMELDLPNPTPTGFGALHSLQEFVEGMDKFTDRTGRDKVAIPYDEVFDVPETTFR